jgi:hypothetical protein
VTPPVAGVATGVSWVVVEEASGRGTIFSAPGVRATPFPLERVERSLEGAAAYCLVAPALNEQLPAILQLATRASVPMFFGVGRAQIDGLGYEELRAVLAEKAELLRCNRLEALQLTNHQDVAGQLATLHFEGCVRTVVISDRPHGLHSSRAACPVTSRDTRTG